MGCVKPSGDEMARTASRPKRPVSFSMGLRRESRVKLGIREGKDQNGEPYPEPYNIDTGEAVEYVTSVDTHYAVEDVATATVTFLICREDGTIKTGDESMA